MKYWDYVDLYKYIKFGHRCVKILDLFIRENLFTVTLLDNFVFFVIMNCHFTCTLFIAGKIIIYKELEKTSL